MKDRIFSFIQLSVTTVTLNINSCAWVVMYAAQKDNLQLSFVSYEPKNVEVQNLENIKVVLTINNKVLCEAA